MRIIVAEFAVEYSGRLTTRLPYGIRTILIKDDGTILIHADKGAKPLNWMGTPNTIAVQKHGRPRGRPKKTAGQPVSLLTPTAVFSDEHPPTQTWYVDNAKTRENLTISFTSIFSDETFPPGVEHGLVKDGVEEHLQTILAANPHLIGEGLTLIGREVRTRIGPVDILLADETSGGTVCVEVKRTCGMSGPEQLGRYLTFLSKNPDYVPVSGMIVAQKISPQAQTMCDERGYGVVLVDYAELKNVYGNMLNI